MRILITGGLGFIGSHFVRLVLKETDAHVVNLDKQTYAGNPENLKDVEKNPRYTFVKGDICDQKIVEKAMKGCDIVVNFAAESHVDRSISTPDAFIRTDVLGTFTLLEQARCQGVKKFVHISTDEVYGSIENGSFTEKDRLSPSSPYSSSKASADMIALSFFTTYNLPIVITRSSNNYGSNQYPEKLIPLFITNALEDQPLPLYGEGLQVRDWIYVEDNCKGILVAMQQGVPGEIYNISSGFELKNVDITTRILKEMKKPSSLIAHVKDRPGHDFRYSINAEKIRKLGYKPLMTFDEGLRKTITWYQEHPEWWKKLKSGEFKEFYKKQYQL